MKVINSDEFDELIKAADIRPRYKRDLKFVRSTETMDESDWLESEILPIWNKSEQGGIVLIQTADDLTLIPFDASKSNSDTTGRMKPVICDFCYTWRSSGQGRYLTFYPYKSDNSISLLCCADLTCSQNVRTKTAAAIKSRAQLREDMTNEDRVQRLRSKLEIFIERIS